MANPNIVNVTTIYGKTAGTVATASAAALVTNSAASGKIYKVNTLYVSNTSTTTGYDITVDIFKGGATSYKIANAVTVPVGSSIVVVGKDTSIYLEENDSLRVLASTAGFLNVVASWEEIN
jgi:hypothetical protein